MRRVSEIFRDCQLYLHHRTLSSAAAKPFKQASERVRQYLKDNGIEDDEGNLVYEFPSPVHGDKVYAGVMLRRNQAHPYFDLDATMILAKKTGLDLIDYFPEVNADNVYLAVQEGDLTEEELRALQRYPDPTYSLWPIEAVEELDE